MDQSTLMKLLVDRVASEVKTSQNAEPILGIRDIGVTEFVGTAIGDTIGLVIASIDPILVEPMQLGRYRSIGILGCRSNSLAVMSMAIDDAVKSTNSEVLILEPIRDNGTDGSGGGQAGLIVIGAEDVSDAHRGIEIALDRMEKYSGDIYVNEAGHVEFHYTARASYCLEKAFGIEVGKAWGMVCGCPAAIGIVVADIAAKAADIDIVSYTAPASGEGFNYQNEVTVSITGDSDAVRQAVMAAREIGRKLLGSMGSEPKSLSCPYIL